MKKIIIVITLICTLSSHLFSMEKSFPNLSKINIYGQSFFSIWDAINITDKSRTQKIIDIISHEEDGIEKLELFLKLYAIFEKLDQEKAIYELMKVIDSNSENYGNYIKDANELEKFIEENQMKLPIGILQDAIDRKTQRIQSCYNIIGPIKIMQMKYKDFSICWSETRSLQEKNLVVSYLISNINQEIASINGLKITQNTKDFEHLLSTIKSLQYKNVILSTLFSAITKAEKLDSPQKGTIEYLIVIFESLKINLNLFLRNESLRLSEWVNGRVNSLVKDIDNLLNDWGKIKNNNI